MGAPFFPPKRGEKPPGVFKTPRGFLKKGAPFFGGFLKNPQKIFPPGEKFFPRGKKFFGGPPFFPQKGGKTPRGF
ncbi:hypothetical protein EDM37_14405 [Staphylococcus aureus]|nr:hypothetical protein EDM37_14405 [Staphylococcus aureus]